MGQRGETKVPIRTCVGCRERDEPQGMIRFVLDTEGELCVDLRQRAPGRGAWLHPRRGCIEQAVRRGGFARAFKRSVGAESAESKGKMRRATEIRTLDRPGLAEGLGQLHLALMFGVHAGWISSVCLSCLRCCSGDS